MASGEGAGEATANERDICRACRRAMFGGRDALPQGPGRTRTPIIRDGPSAYPLARVLVGEPVPTSPGDALADDDARPRPEPRQQEAKPWHRQRHAPGGGPKARP